MLSMLLVVLFLLLIWSQEKINRGQKLLQGQLEIDYQLTMLPLVLTCQEEAKLVTLIINNLKRPSPQTLLKKEPNLEV
jgi:hypothetical protein